MHIDESKVGTEGSFPMEAHIAYANKIARAVSMTILLRGTKLM
jgi:hypothetical protein